MRRLNIGLALASLAFAIPAAVAPAQPQIGLELEVKQTRRVVKRHTRGGTVYRYPSKNPPDKRIRKTSKRKFSLKSKQRRRRARCGR